METEIRKSQTDAERGEKSSKRGRDRCLLSLPCLPLCLCPSCEHSAAVAHNLYFIHYSQLRIDWEQGTYHRSARGRERWKGRNVQLDQREGCTAKRTNVHHGCVWASVCVCVWVFRCMSTKSAVLYVRPRARCPDVWFTTPRCRARGAYPFKSVMLTHTHTVTYPRQSAASAPFSRKMSRGISFPLLPVCSDSGKPAVAQTLAGSPTWHCRAFLTRWIALRRTWQRSQNFVACTEQSCCGYKTLNIQFEWCDNTEHNPL